MLTPEQKLLQQERVKSIQKFLKHSVRWRQWGEFNIAREYQLERYMLLESREENNPRVFEIVHFVSDVKIADHIFKYNPSYNQALYDIEGGFSFVKQNRRKVNPYNKWWEPTKE